MSQASTRFGLDSSLILEDVKGWRRRAVEKVKQGSTSQDVLIFLVAFRILNALSIKTFFQPDEYFQSLEPAWEIAFGADSGAWITWVRIIWCTWSAMVANIRAQEWKNHLRSAIHPALFAAVYWAASSLAWVLRLSPSYRADLLVAAPKMIQAVIAALGDYYTWKLGERVYGVGSNEAWAAVCTARKLCPLVFRALQRRFERFLADFFSLP